MKKAILMALLSAAIVASPGMYAASGFASPGNPTPCVASDCHVTPPDGDPSVVPTTTPEPTATPEPTGTVIPTSTPDSAAGVTGSNAVSEYTGSASIRLTATDPGWGVAYLYYSLDGQHTKLVRVPANKSEFATTITVAAPANGSAVHVLEFWSQDNAGNVEKVNKANFTVAAATSASTVSPVWRFRQLGLTGSYLWTIDPAEKTSIVANLTKMWLLEGVAFNINNANPVNNAPLWRFRNLKSGSYLYTADPGEKADILANMTSTWALDGPAWNVARTADSSALPVWRFRCLKNSTYFWTADPNEKSTIETTLQSTYQLEGVAYYIGQ